MAKITDEYEYQERAAIRSLEGGFEPVEANRLALIDVVGRRKSQKQLEHSRRNAQSEILITASVPDKIKLLREQAEEIGNLMRRSPEGQERNEFFDQWTQIQGQIIELKKKGI